MNNSLKKYSQFFNHPWLMAGFIFSILGTLITIFTNLGDYSTIQDAAHLYHIADMHWQLSFFLTQVVYLAIILVSGYGLFGLQNMQYRSLRLAPVLLFVFGLLATLVPAIFLDVYRELRQIGFSIFMSNTTSAGSYPGSGFIGGSILFWYASWKAGDELLALEKDPESFIKTQQAIKAAKTERKGSHR